MNKLVKKVKIKLKEHQYKKYIDEHIENVRKAYNEVITCPELELTEELCASLYERILVHDASKYSDEEFDAYRKNFYPINQVEKLSNLSAFNKAWEHHYKNNDHHWQNECRQLDGLMTIDRQAAILENICDWLAMGYKFNDRPSQYYAKHKDEIKLGKEDREYLERVIEILDKHPYRDWRKIGIV